MPPKTKAKGKAKAAPAPVMDEDESDGDNVPLAKAKGRKEKPAKRTTDDREPPRIPPLENMKMNQHLKSLADRGFPQLLSEYQSLRSQSEKRSWYWNRYAKDKGEAVLKSLQTETRSKDTSLVDKAGLWTKEEIADAEGVPGPKHTAEWNVIMEEVCADLEWQEHHVPALATRGVKLYKYAVRGRVSATEHKRSKSEQLVLGQHLSERQFASALSVMDTDRVEPSSGSGDPKGPDDIWDETESGGHEIRVEPHVESWMECVNSCHKLLKQANVRMAHVAECRQRLRVHTSLPGSSEVAKAYRSEFDGKIAVFTTSVDDFSLRLGTEVQPGRESVCAKIDEYEESKTQLESMMRDNWEYVKRVNAALD